MMESIEKNISKISEEEMQIVEYLFEHKQRFKEINVQWISCSHVLEEEVIKTVEDPEGYILKGGGKIYIAL